MTKTSPPGAFGGSSSPHEASSPARQGLRFPRRQLGRTGMEITRVGFGAWAVGGGEWSFGWGPQDDADSIDAIRHAVECGLNWVDTAAVYGLGHSEAVVAAALEPYAGRDRPYVFTKCGLRWDPADPMKPARRVGRPDSIRQEAEDSLRRLHIERIDLYQMHWPPEAGTPVEAYWTALLGLKEAGKIAAAGLSNHSVNRSRRRSASATSTPCSRRFR